MARRRVGSRLVLYGLVAMNWFGYCVISWADPRYRYVAEIVFCVLTAIAVENGSRSVLRPHRGRKRGRELS